MKWEDVIVVYSDDDGMHQWVVKNYPLRGSARITSTDNCQTFVVATTGYTENKEVSREFPTLKAAMTSLRKWHNTNVNRHKHDTVFPFQILTQLGRYERHPTQAVSPPLGA